MNRRGAALLVALLALMLAGAIASAALATGHLRWRAGLARRAAAEASLAVSSALEQHLGSWSTAFDSIPVGGVLEIDRVDGPRIRRRDSLARLSASLFQLKSVVEIGPVSAPAVGRDAAVLLVLQTGAGPVDGIGSGILRDPLESTPRRVPGGWWRVD